MEPPRLDIWNPTVSIDDISSVGVSRTFASEQETLICDVLTTLW